MQRFVAEAICEVPFAFSQADDAAGPCNAHTFIYERGPCRWRHEGENEAGVDDIKGTIGKGERFCGIHHPKMRIVQPLYKGVGMGIFDHVATNINASNLNRGMLKRHVVYPSTGATANIQDFMNAGE